jgi:anti-sigma-K factor RskA
MNPSNEQSDDLLGAYALGALDQADRAAVEALLAASPEHQEELRQLRETVALLPYAAEPTTPPERVRQRLMARVADAAAPAAAPQTAAPQAARRPGAPGSRWIAPAMAALTCAVIALATLTLFLNNTAVRLDGTNRQLVAALADMQTNLATTQTRQDELAAQLAESQRQLDRVSAELASSEQQLAGLQERLDQDAYVISFVSAPGVATRQLTSASTDLSAQGEMYMYPGRANAVVIFSGLPPLAPGQVYQFWLADSERQVASVTFMADARGVGHIIVEAPREVNSFSEVMITVEPSGGSSTPSDQVVLEGAL